MEAMSQIGEFSKGVHECRYRMRNYHECGTGSKNVWRPRIGIDSEREVQKFVRKLSAQQVREIPLLWQCIWK